MIIKVKKKRKINGLDRAGKKKSNSKPFGYFVCGKILQKSPFSSLYEPVRLILLKSSWKCTYHHRKTERIVLHSTKNLRKSQVSCLFTPLCPKEHVPAHWEDLSALRLSIILSYLCISQTYTFIIHLISLLQIIINYAKL